MVDPTSSLGEDVDEASAPRCDSCGAPILQRASHRVVTWVEDAAVETRHFCDESCRADWRDERGRG